MLDVNGSGMDVDALLSDADAPESRIDDFGLNDIFESNENSFVAQMLGIEELRSTYVIW